MAAVAVAMPVTRAAQIFRINAALIFLFSVFA
jgi:hypothetical protein